MGVEVTVKDLLDDYFTETEVCEALGITKVTLQSKRSKGHALPKPIKRGRRVLYPKLEFIRWFKGAQKSAETKSLLRVK